MDSVIKRMLVNVYELEGVLLLAQERGDATPETVLSIIKEKAELPLDDANSLNIFVETPDAENPQEPVEESFPETEEPLNEETATLDEPEVAESNEDETESEAFLCSCFNNGENQTFPGERAGRRGTTVFLLRGRD